MARRPRLPAAGATAGRSVPNAGELMAAQARLSRPVFTADSRFVVFSIEPAKADLNKAKKDKKRPDEMPKNALGIMDVCRAGRSRARRAGEEFPGAGRWQRASSPICWKPSRLRIRRGSGPARERRDRRGNPTARRGQVQTRLRLNHPHPAAELLRNRRGGKKRNTAPIWSCETRRPEPSARSMTSSTTL